MRTKRILASVLVLLTLGMNNTAVFAIQDVPNLSKLQAAPNARNIDLAFVFDGPSDKHQASLKVFQTTIARSLLPDYKASFSDDLIFTGDWTEKGVASASEKALASKATIPSGTFAKDSLPLK